MTYRSNLCVYGAFVLAVEVLSAAGEALPGFAREDCQTIHADGVRQAVRWDNNARLPIGQPLRLRFHLENAGLYSFRIREAGQP